MKYRLNVKNLWQGLAHLSPGQKLLAGALFLVIVVTWLAVCGLVVSLFV
jgi:hypothetical protein